MCLHTIENRIVNIRFMCNVFVVKKMQDFAVESRWIINGYVFDEKIQM